VARVRSPRTLVGLAVLALVVVLVAVGLPLINFGPAPSAPPSAPLSSGLPFVPDSPAAPGSSVSPGSSSAITPATPFPTGTGLPLASGATPAPQNGEPGIVATRIQVPRLGIDLPVVEGDGVDAPLHMAAHYPGTSWPGGGSNIYLYAHARQQMFQNLWDAQLGDLVYLDLADGSERVYQVSKIEPDIAWDDLSVLDPTPTEQLTLQTCTGTLDTDPRFLVIATPVS
jgi:LPXTG-site transpeptidase (sortase) family protein